MSQMIQKFLDDEHKSITFMGMSGVGKTYLSCQLAQWGWAHHSCDYYIGAHVLADKLDAPVTTEDLSPLSRFVGRIGDPALGGLDLDTFKDRQQAYYDAECRAISACAPVSGQHCVNDTTGSFCEITDEALIEKACSESLLVYLKATPEEEQEVLKRAREYPKPLFFPSALFDEKLAAYQAEQGIDDVARIVPDEFSRWVFPHLFAARLPKYQALADRYGVSIVSTTFHGVQSEEDFLRIVAEACLEKNEKDARYA